MTSWPVPTGFNNSYTDAVTGATPLGVMKEGLSAGKPVTEIMGNIPSHMELFYGHMGGSMGEIAALALLLGFGYMLFRKVIKMHIPIAIFLTITVFTGILWSPLINPVTINSCWFCKGV